MDFNSIRLHRLSLLLKIAVSCLILVIAGGLVASVVHMHQHYCNKDEQPELTIDDVIGSFHGLKQPARLKEAINGDMKEHVTTDEERKAMDQWLSSNRISEDYDSLDLGDFAPAEIIAINCLRCHSRDAKEGDDIGKTVPLDYWDDVKQVAFAKNLDPTPSSILITSTHTHALTMPLVGLAACLLFLCTAWPRMLRHLVVMLTFAALLLDIGSWWLARENPFFCYMILVSGAAFGGLVGLQLLCAFLDTWIGGLFSKSAD